MSRPSIKCLGDDKKPLLDTLRAYPETKTDSDVEQKLDVFNAFQLKALQAFLEDSSSGWTQELPSATLDKLKILVEARLRIKGALDKTSTPAAAHSTSDVQTYPTAGGRSITPGEGQTGSGLPPKRARTVIPSQVISPNPDQPRQKRTRRSPQSPPRVHVARSTRRTAEGRRYH